MAGATSRNNKESRRWAQTEKEKSSQLPLSDRATKRVIAPFVRIIRKGIKPVEVEEGKQFIVHLQKKPSVLLRDLSAFLSDCVDLRSLLHETVDVLQVVTKSAGVTLYMMDLSSQEIYVSRQVPVEERYKIRWKIEKGTTVASYVAYKKNYVLVDDILQDARFPEGIGYEGESVKSVLCVPVVTPDGECFAVIEMYRLLFEESFTRDDLKISIVVTGWMGAAIHQNSARLALQRQQELNDYLLDLTKCYIGETVGMEKMIQEIVKLSKVTLTAERGLFFVIDRERGKETEEVIADLFDDYDEGKETEEQQLKKSRVRFGKERGVTGLGGIASIVARSGGTINVKDAYNDSRFNKEIDQRSGFITRSILCMPIKTTQGVLGVLQVVNKKNGSFFTHTDELLTKTFSSYSALALQHTNVNNKMNSLKRLNNCYLKIIQFMKISCEHYMDEIKANEYTNIPEDFFGFHWYADPEDTSQLPLFCIYMMLNIIKRSDISVDHLTNFVLTVRKLCRHNPYHNFVHAFSTVHCMYLILKRNIKRFTDIEVKGLLIAALCGDVDHPGVTNSFLELSKEHWAHLYSDNALENHQYYVTTLILQDNKIFPNLTKEEEKLLYDEIREGFFSKNSLNYFTNKAQLETLLETYSFDWDNELHRKYLKGIMMKSCDVSNQCKPFLVSKRTLDSLYEEYYAQGDLIKDMGLCCVPLMDRNKQHRIAEDQVFFLTGIVLPCVNLLQKFLPNTENLSYEASSLLRTWEDVINVRGRKCWHQDDSIVTKSYG